MYVGTWAASREHVPPRRRNSAHPSIVPFQNFETADGWIVVACPKEKFWALLCRAIDRPELAGEFPTFADRDRRRDELSPVLEDVFRSRTSAEWLAVLGGAGVPCSPVNDVPAALEEAKIVEYEHPRLGAVRQVASPLRLSGPEPPVRPAPARGEHTEQVLAEVCGYEPERIRALAESGVFGVESKGERDVEASTAT
jgi:crotonobetainyl-CoA:carnitine CoA-transferase CaiB-like acyl-CoA transferase